jgi:uncharacterized membrane protein YccC
VVLSAAASIGGSGRAGPAAALRAMAPAMLFGLRLWASVCLALYVAFWLQLDTPAWAGTTAALACQPQLGASLRKGWFRLIGTAIGAVAVVFLSACFPQQRAPFLAGLALWGGLCALMATVLRNFAAYAAALAGLTAAIIASDDLGLVGGPGGHIFLLAVNRTSEIWLGIVCAGIVLAGTDFGTARRRLAGQIAGLAAEITGRLGAGFSLVGREQAGTQEVRRDLIRRVIALDPIIDQAVGESANLRYRSGILQGAVDGLFAALAGWRTAAHHLELSSSGEGRGEGAAILEQLPPALRSAPVDGTAPAWVAAPSKLGRICTAAARSIAALPAAAPSLRLLADRTAEALLGVALALDAVALLAGDASRTRPRHRLARLRVPDWLPSLVNGGRALVTIGAVALFWIVTGWPGGAGAITWAAISVIIFAPRADEAYATATGYMCGAAIAAIAAAIIKFAVLPGVAGFAGFALVLGLWLVPAGALMTQPRQNTMFFAMATLLVPLLGPQNQMTYDTAEFYNATLATIAGLAAAVLAFRLLPPLSPALRTRRVLAFTLRDLRRLAVAAAPPLAEAWTGRCYGRFAALPEQATSEQRAWLVAALSVGVEIVRLRHWSATPDTNRDLDRACAAIARGDIANAIEDLARLDRRLAAPAGDNMAASEALRARAGLLAIREALAQYSSYFDAAAAA